MNYDISKTLETTPGQVRVRAMEVLSAEGFGVLTEIDVQATMKKKLDRDMRYEIARDVKARLQRVIDKI